MSEWLLTVDQLQTYFPLRNSWFGRSNGYVKAVDGVSFRLRKGETLGLVGESGCGKSTTGRSILSLIKPTSGSVVFDGNEMTTMRSSELRKLRQRMQIVFQDPYASLNPKLTIYSALEEAISVRADARTKEERREQVMELLKLVGLNPSQADRYPHEFSGGQRQRIGIARALAVSPELIVADEPVSALDVSIQAQIVNLLQDLQESLGLTYLFISHDLGVVKHISNRIAVMYLGRIVEIGEKAQLFSNPLHPYTQALMSAVPSTSPLFKKERIMLKGDVPSPANPPSGCAFHTRCGKRMEICQSVRPVEREVHPGHYVSCHLYTT
ncbi:dipeptide ABC transporter ATP-binding protein [Brevibacillus ruminantium]|uniref:Dipeptide ABC transporter ATP-binding protein n=1 Tax=Brevibacillus ruminantium TaxID=2950604 RepID=A0ABY4WD24_9BACL|nr:dipeptide ABC transporter ATP-binding protein [Brevibacillus ruminantium]USG64058.1 dipeptide ABC transporter ATP-binding protein [Brevibacillus ruminantium]